MASFYTVHRTDITAPSITVPKFSKNTSDLDITLAGKIRLEYGAELDQAYLNLLENFSCPESITTPGTPDLTKTTDDQLSTPTTGQLWFNSSRQKIYYWTGTAWAGTTNRGEYAANWGMIMHGQHLPKPVNSATGRIFEYNECIWSVAPATFLGKPGYIACATDSNALVTMRYRYAGGNQMMDGQANYLIIGIPGESEESPRPTPPAPSPTSSVTPTPTPSTTATMTPTPTPTSSLTPTPTQSLSPSPTPQPSISPTPAPSNTPAVTPSPTPQATPTPTPAPAGRYEWTFSNSWSGQENHGCRPEDMGSGEANDWLNRYFIDNPCDASRVGQYVQADWCDPGGPTSIGLIGYDCLFFSN